MAEVDVPDVVSGEEELTVERGRRGSEEEVYTLLFQEVDKDGSGLVGVASLVDYLQKMQLGTTGGQGSGLEEVYDSHQDVHRIQYNLELLKAMLKEVSGESELVDEASYSRVIRLWVKDVRDRSSQQQALEVSQLSSDSEDNNEEDYMATPRPQLSFEAADQSFETSGGNSSTHSGFDMLSSLEDDRRRLIEKERQLQASLDHTEEQLRGLQAENSTLISQLQGLQQQRVRVEALESQNTAIIQSLRSEEMKCHKLTEEAEKMSQQLTEAEREATVLRDRVSEVEAEREREEEEASELQQRLAAKEELLCQERERQDQLQEQLTSLMADQYTLRSKVTELEKNNTLLQRENEELHSASVAPATGPAYSTPFRSTEPPSLHEEISHHGNLSGPSLLSPLVGIDSHHGNKESCRLEDHYDNSEPSLSCSHGNLTLEDLEHIAQNSSNKFHSKTEVIMKMLSELTAVSSHNSHHSHLPSHSSDSITEVSHRKRERDTANLRQLVTCVKKLYSEKKKLKQQVGELQSRLDQKKGTEDVDTAVQTVATLPVAKATPPPLLPRTGHSLVGRVLRGVVWSLCLVVMVTLLLAVLVWLHEHLAPCCHGNLTPGGMVWAIIEPHITVTHHGYI